MSKLTEGRAWRALLAHQVEMQNVQMRDLFAQDPSRFAALFAPF